MTDLKIGIVTDRAAQEVVGFDTTILTMPKAAYVIVGNQKAIAVTLLHPLLRGLAEEQAAGFGLALHHADFVVTSNPATVEAWGTLHDCDTCRESLQKSLRYLRENPGEDLIVGQLHWAEPT